MQKLFQENEQRLTDALQYCRRWLYLMIAVTLLLLIMIVMGRLSINPPRHPIPFIIITFIILIYINWWYWTVKIVKILLHQHLLELIVLKDIIADMKEIRLQLSKLNPFKNRAQ